MPNPYLLLLILFLFLQSLIEGHSQIIDLLVELLLEALERLIDLLPFIDRMLLVLLNLPTEVNKLRF